MFVIFEEIATRVEDNGKPVTYKRKSIVNIDLIQRVIPDEDDANRCLIFLSSGYPIVVEGTLMRIYDQLEELTSTQHKRL